MPELDFEKGYDSEEWLRFAEEILSAEGFRRDVSRAGGTDHVVVFAGDDLVLKIYRPGRDGFERERTALEIALGRSSFSTPEIVAAGSRDGLRYLLLTRISGDEISRVEFLALDRSDQVAIVTGLAAGLCQLHELSSVDLGLPWNSFVEQQAETFIERQIRHGVNPKIIGQLPQYIEESLPIVPRGPCVFMHGDVHFGNMRFLSKGAGPIISGLFDFADSRTGWHEYDILAIGVLILQGERDLQREFLRAYGYANAEMDEEMRRRLMMLTMLYETADLRRYAMRLRPDAVELDLYDLERAIWSFV